MKMYKLLIKQQLLKERVQVSISLKAFEATDLCSVRCERLILHLIPLFVFIGRGLSFLFWVLKNIILSEIFRSSKKN